jgi:hypothetical protein
MMSMLLCMAFIPPPTNVIPAPAPYVLPACVGKNCNVQRPAVIPTHAAPGPDWKWDTREQCWYRILPAVSPALVPVMPQQFVPQQTVPYCPDGSCWRRR